MEVSDAFPASVPPIAAAVAAADDDASPSLHVYEGPEGGWYCFSCRRGTSLYDLAAPLWGLRTRGPDFLELKRRLTELLL